jgi:hypothetical protein
MILERFPDVAALPREERLMLAEEIVQKDVYGVTPDGPAFGDGSLDQEIFEAMMKRMEAYEKDPSLGIPFEVSMQRIRDNARERHASHPAR